jgi:hypothetical protein
LSVSNNGCAQAAPAHDCCQDIRLKTGTYAGLSIVYKKVQEGAKPTVFSLT